MVFLFIISENNKSHRTLANLDITFVKPSDKAPASDADVQLLPEIHHQFPGERRKPAFVITAFFSAASIVAFVGFLVILFKIGVNFNNLPSNASGKLFSLIFLVSEISLLSLIILGIDFGFTWYSLFVLAQD